MTSPVTICGAQHPDGLVCTLPPAHAGVHTSANLLSWSRQLRGPGFADPSWFDPTPGEPGPPGKTLEQLADVIRSGFSFMNGVHRDQALDEILRRISNSLGDD